MWNKIDPHLRGYGVAILTVASALLLTLLLQPMLGSTTFSLFFAAVAISAWYGGMGAGLVATALSTLAIQYFLISPSYGLASQGLGSFVRLGVFVFVTLLISSLNAELRRAKRRSEKSLQSLQESEIRFSRLVESNIIGVIVANINGEVIEANNAFLKMVGYTREEMQSGLVRWRDMTPPDYGEVSDRSIAELKSTGVCTPFEKEYIRKDGTRVPVLLGSAFTDSKQDKVIGFVLDLSDRKRSEKALKESERRFRRLVELNIFGVVFGNFNGGIQYANDAFLKMVGYEREDVLLGNLRWDTMTPPEFLHLDAKAAEELRTHGVATPFEKEYIRKDGTRVPILIGGALLQEPYDQQEEIATFYVDLTERKQAEEALKTSEERFRRAVLDAPFPMMIHAEDGEILQINHVWTELTGYTRDEIPTIAEWTQKADREPKEVVPSDIERLYDLNDKVDEGEFTVITKNGTKRIWHFSSASLGRLTDNRRLIISMATDITERKQAEEALRYLAETSIVLTTSLDYEATLERVAQIAVPDMADWCSVEICQDDGSIRRVPVAYTDSSKAELARQLQQYAPEPNGANPIARVLRTGQSALISELSEDLLVSATRDAEHLRIVREMGIKSAMIVPLVARHRILGTITFVTAQSGRRYSAANLALAEDIARRAALAIDNARAYREVQEANRMKDEFLATLSHELRTPLNAMLGWTQLLRTRKFDQATATRALETIDRNAKSLNQLIEDILDVSRIIRGQLSLNVRPVKLVSVIEGAIETVSPAAQAKDIQIKSRLDSSLGPVLGDANRLQQVVWNLLSNAVKFTPKGGQVEVRLEKVEEELKVNRLQVVRDSEAVATLGASAFPVSVSDSGRSDSEQAGGLSATGVGSKESSKNQPSTPTQPTNIQPSTPAQPTNIQPTNIQPSTPTQPSTQYAQIRVSDTGQGIAPDFLPHMFERFRQADSTTTRSHGGLGLGLAIVRHLVELHGGTVYAQSPGLGQGATFIVELPIKAISPLPSEPIRVLPTDKAEAASVIDSLSLEGLRVLVVDDEADARELLITMLSEYHAEVKATASAGEALEALSDFRPHVLISDIAMPGEDGYSLIGKVRQLDVEQGGRIPAVALTAYARAEDRKQALLAGFQLHVPKPVDPTELAAVVANLAGRIGNVKR